MATSPTSSVVNQFRRQENQLGLQRERLGMRAKELQRRRLILQNELSSPGMSEAERDYINQRIQTLSSEEDTLGPQLARAERDLRAVHEKLLAYEQTQVQNEQRQQRVLGSRAAQQGVQTGDPERLKKAQVLYQRRQNEREKTYARLKSQAKKSAALIIVSALVIAGIADLLSIIDFGWLVSWLIPIVSWFIVRRIASINRSVDAISSAQSTALSELRLMRQRLRPALIASGQSRLFASAETLEIRQAAVSYVQTFVRDTIVTQLVELIPGVDVLPLYLGQVVKIINDQRKAYRTAQEVLVPYRQTLNLLTKLEQFELQTIAQPTRATALVTRVA